MNCTYITAAGAQVYGDSAAKVRSQGVNAEIASSMSQLEALRLLRSLIWRCLDGCLKLEQLKAGRLRVELRLFVQWAGIIPSHGERGVDKKCWC